MVTVALILYLWRWLGLLELFQNEHSQTGIENPSLTLIQNLLAANSDQLLTWCQGHSQWGLWIESLKLHIVFFPYVVLPPSLKIKFVWQLQTGLLLFGWSFFLYNYILWKMSLWVWWCEQVSAKRQCCCLQSPRQFSAAVYSHPV